jgi:sporulation protein YlmC with PRC-barrel domain
MGWAIGGRPSTRVAHISIAGKRSAGIPLLLRRAPKSVRAGFQFPRTVKYAPPPSALEALPMRKFLTELRGKTVMTNDGQILGMIDNFVVDTVTGGIAHVLVTPSEDVEQRLFQSDASGRLVLPFKSMRAVKDVVVMEIGK